MEQSLEQALVMSRNVTQGLKSKLRGLRQLVSLELTERGDWRREDRSSLEGFLKQRLDESCICPAW